MGRRRGAPDSGRQPFATGFLSGAYHRGKRVTGPWRTADSLYSSGYLGRTAELAATLGEVARSHDATVAQVALAYVLRHPNVLRFPVPPLLASWPRMPQRLTLN